MSTPIDNEKNPPSGPGPRLPSLPAADTPFNAKVKEILESMLGRRGSKYDQVVTWRDMIGQNAVSRQAGQREANASSPTGPTTGTSSAQYMAAQFEKELRNSPAFKSLGRKINNLEDLERFPAEIRTLFNTSLLDMARQRQADIQTIERRIQNAEVSFASRTSELTASLDAAQAGVRQVDVAYADKTRALASSITQVSARLDSAGGEGVTVEEELTAQADAINGLEGRWGVRVNVGGKISGVMLNSTEEEADFIILADKFGIFTSGGDVMPFGVDASGIYMNGVVRISAGGSTLSDIAAKFGVTISYTDAYWRVNADGDNVNASITLTANLSASLTGNVTWTKTGTGSTPPAAGTTNTWTVFADDQTGETTTYIASLVSGGVTYTDSVTINRLRDGVTGERGPTGVPGTITGYGAAYGISTGAWNSQLANRVIRNMLTGETLTSNLAATDHLLLGDTVTLGNGTDFATTRYWDGTGTWTPLGVVIDGNLLVTKTVSASKLTAGEIETGQDANARINIGDTTFIGFGTPAIRSPLHVSKVSPLSNQVLISALNDQDDAAAIWGANAGGVSGNAVTGTWHDTGEAGLNRWQLLGALGSGLYGAAVAGNAFGVHQAGAFRYYNYANSNGPSNTDDFKHAVGLATSTHALTTVGPIEMFGSTSTFAVGGTVGTAGQVFTSNGVGLAPSWQTISSSVTYANVKTAVAAADTALTLPRNLQVTGLTVPTSGVGIELGYGNKGDGTNRGHVIAYNRNTSGYVPMMLSASMFTFADGVVTFDYSPVAPTPATSSNGTTVPTTAYVVSRIAQDAPTKTGSGASGTWGISISGNAATATSASSASYASSAGSAPASGGTSTSMSGGSASGTTASFSSGSSDVVVGRSQSTAYSGGVFYNDASGRQLLCAANTHAAYAFSGKGRIYAADGFTAFTGAHESLLHNDAPYEIGDIAIDINIIHSEDINNATSEVAISTEPQQKGAIGVIAEAREIDEFVLIAYEHWWEYQDTHKVVIVNALGEGHINVCGEGGTIEKGDLIVCSSMPGKGMRQADDIVRGHTVARARETVSFEPPEQVKQVACVYLCG